MRKISFQLTIKANFYAFRKKVLLESKVIFELIIIFLKCEIIICQNKFVVEIAFLSSLAQDDNEFVFMGSFFIWSSRQVSFSLLPDFIPPSSPQSPRLSCQAIKPPRRREELTTKMSSNENLNRIIFALCF